MSSAENMKIRNCTLCLIEKLPVHNTKGNREHQELRVLELCINIVYTVKQKPFVADQGDEDQWALHCFSPGPLDHVISDCQRRPRLEPVPVVFDDMASSHWVQSTGQSPLPLVVVGELNWW